MAGTECDLAREASHKQRIAGQEQLSTEDASKGKLAISNPEGVHQQRVSSQTALENKDITSSGRMMVPCSTSSAPCLGADSVITLQAKGVVQSPHPPIGSDLC